MKDGILISATQGEQIKVERVYAGVVIDRYMTADIRKQPACKRAWMAKLATVLDQDHVNIQIEIPPVPTQQGNVFDRINNLSKIVTAQTNLINTLLCDAPQQFTMYVPGSLVDDLTSAVERAEQNASAERL